MRLRRVSLAGFKTFAGRTELALEPGLTAVVGPNGSGKSNFVDAIRWALGETSARELRGARMDEVIFAGGSGRGPMGVAQVELVIDNEDGRLAVEDAEVAIRRRVTRNGESEYRVNGCRTRLRDVERLLSATGLTQNGYAVVAQNDVEAIIRATPAQRRALVEEAAGVRGLRTARDDALGRVEGVEARLLRLDDLLADAVPRCDDLTAQAAVALEQRALAGRLAELRGSLAREEWRAAREHARQIRHRLGTARHRAAAATEVERGLAGRLEAERGALAACRDEQRRAAAQLEAARLEAERAAGDTRRWSDREAASALQRAAASVELRRVGGEAAAAEAQIESLAGSAADAESRLADMEERLSRLAACARDAEADRRRADGELETLRAAHAAAEGALVTAEAEAREQRGRVQLLAEACDSLGESARLARERAAQLSGEAAAAGERRSELEKDVHIAGVELDAARERVEGAAAAARTAESEVEDLRRAASEAAARAAALHGQVEGALGGGGAVARALADGAVRATRLLDTLRVDDPADAPAVEAALEWHLAAWLVDDAEGATALLRRDGVREELLWAGLPLPAAPVAPHGVRPALDALAVEDPRAAGALAHCLHRVWLAPDPEAARAAVVAAGGRAVLPDGTVIDSAGVRGGGRPGGTLALAHAERQAAETARGAVVARDGAVRRAAAASAALRAAEEEGERRRSRLAAAHAAAAEASAAAAAAAAAATAEERRSADLDGQRLARDEARRRAQVAAARAADEEQRCRRAVDAAAVAGAATRAAQEAAGAALTEALSALRRHEMELATAKPEARDLQRRLSAARTAAETARHRARAAGMRLASLEGDVLVALARLRGGVARALAASRDVEWAEVGMERAAPPVAAAEARVAALEGERAGAAVACARAADECAATEAELAAAEARVAELAEAVREDERDEGPEPDAGAAEKAEREIVRLERRIASLGPVNALAPEQLESLTTRVGRLRADRDDLRWACSDLRDLAAHLGEEIERRFEAVFGAVAYHFRLLYEELFPGGRATLRLEQPEIPAEEAAADTDGTRREARRAAAGVEILAQPAGKRLQALSLLSGGERALTALAVILALQQVNPSPFYVFDEIDAPLDDANVGRLVRLLQRLSRTQQFLVVTHNHITMAAAAALYGVTLHRDGTSTVLSVRFVDGHGPVPLEPARVAAVG